MRLRYPCFGCCRYVGICSWKGETVSITSTKGRVHFENLEEKENLHFNAERISGTFGSDIFPQSGSIISLELFGGKDDELLDTGDFIRNIDYWNQFTAKRQAYFTVPNRFGLATIGNIQGVSCVDFVK